MNKPLNLIGQKFSRLTVVSRSENGKRGKARWFCRCDCGSEKTVSGDELVGGKTRSCGCWRKEMPSLKFRTHGKSKTKEFGVWCGIKNRCFNKKVPAYKWYGGRGITVCERWLTFENFLEDMGERPDDNHTIERKDVDGNYEPGNCIWLHKSGQSENRRVVDRLVFNGVSDTISGWSKKTGIPYGTIYRRRSEGRPISQILFKGSLKDV